MVFDETASIGAFFYYLTNGLFEVKDEVTSVFSLWLLSTYRDLGVETLEKVFDR